MLMIACQILLLFIYEMVKTLQVVVLIHVVETDSTMAAGHRGESFVFNCTKNTRNPSVIVLELLEFECTIATAQHVCEQKGVVSVCMGQKYTYGPPSDWRHICGLACTK